MSLSVNVQSVLQNALKVMPSVAMRHAPLIEAACAEFGIDNPRRIGMFLAQTAHESGNFRWMEEIWGPTAAQSRYDTRTDLGNTPEVDGDGELYKGRGSLEVTGKSNYEACGDALGLDLIGNPQLLSDPANGWRASGWWWKEHGLNELADTCSVRRCTHVVNGGYNGETDREQRYNAIMGHLRAQLLPDGTPQPLAASRTITGAGTASAGGAVIAAAQQAAPIATTPTSPASGIQTIAQHAHYLWQDAHALMVLGFGVLALGLAMVVYARWHDHQLGYK